MPKQVGKVPLKKKKAKSPAKKEKVQPPPQTKTVLSPFTTPENMLANLEAKCALGDLEALAFALEILPASTEPAPVWLIPPLAKIVNKLLGDTVVSKGPRATRRAILDRNWTDFRRFAIIRKLIADGSPTGKKILKKQAYALAKDDLVAAGVYAEPPKIKASCRRTIALLRKPSFSPAREFPVEPEVFFALLGVDVQE